MEKEKKKKKWSYYSKLKKGDVTIFPNYMKSKKNSHRFFPIQSANIGKSSKNYKPQKHNKKKTKEQEEGRKKKGDKK